VLVYKQLRQYLYFCTSQPGAPALENKTYSEVASGPRQPVYAVCLAPSKTFPRKPDAPLSGLLSVAVPPVGEEVYADSWRYCGGRASQFSIRIRMTEHTLTWAREGVYADSW
jgi:hypothetical protein